MPHLAGKEFLETFKIESGTALAHALTYVDFAELARSYGRMGGLDRIATTVKSIRAERDGRTLLLDGGDTWTNSWTSLKTNGQDMVDVMALLRPDAMTGHLGVHRRGARRRPSLKLGFLSPRTSATASSRIGCSRPTRCSMLAASKSPSSASLSVHADRQPAMDDPGNGPSASATATSRKEVDDVRAAGAELRAALAQRLRRRPQGRAHRQGHRRPAVRTHSRRGPGANKVDKTLIVATRSNGKFVSRLDLDVQGTEIKSFHATLIPVFADAVEPDAETARPVASTVRPMPRSLACSAGRSLCSTGARTLNGTLDYVICDAITTLTQIALSPGARGTSLLPGQESPCYANATAMTTLLAIGRPCLGRGSEILERTPTTSSTLIPSTSRAATWCASPAVSAKDRRVETHGQRISDMTLLKSGAPVEPEKTMSSPDGPASIRQRRGRPSGMSSPGISKRRRPDRRAETAAVKITRH